MLRTSSEQPSKSLPTSQLLFESSEIPLGQYGLMNLLRHDPESGSPILAQIQSDSQSIHNLLPEISVDDAKEAISEQVLWLHQGLLRLWQNPEIRKNPHSKKSVSAVAATFHIPEKDLSNAIQELRQVEKAGKNVNNLLSFVRSLAKEATSPEDWFADKTKVNADKEAEKMAKIAVGTAQFIALFQFLSSFRLIEYVSNGIQPLAGPVLSPILGGVTLGSLYTVAGMSLTRIAQMETTKPTKKNLLWNIGLSLGVVGIQSLTSIGGLTSDKLGPTDKRIELHRREQQEYVMENLQERDKVTKESDPTLQELKKSLELAQKRLEDDEKRLREVTPQRDTNPAAYASAIARIVEPQGSPYAEGSQSRYNRAKEAYEQRLAEIGNPLAEATRVLNEQGTEAFFEKYGPIVWGPAWPQMQAQLQDYMKIAPEDRMKIQDTLYEIAKENRPQASNPFTAIQYFISDLTKNDNGLFLLIMITGDLAVYATLGGLLAMSKEYQEKYRSSEWQKSSKTFIDSARKVFNSNLAFVQKQVGQSFRAQRTLHEMFSISRRNNTKFNIDDPELVPLKSKAEICKQDPLNFSEAVLTEEYSSFVHTYVNILMPLIVYHDVGSIHKLGKIVLNSDIKDDKHEKAKQERAEAVAQEENKLIVKFAKEFQLAIAGSTNLAQAIQLTAEFLTKPSPITIFSTEPFIDFFELLTQSTTKMKPLTLKMPSKPVTSTLRGISTVTLDPLGNTLRNTPGIRNVARKVLPKDAGSVLGQEIAKIAPNIGNMEGTPITQAFVSALLNLLSTFSPILRRETDKPDIFLPYYKDSLNKILKALVKNDLNFLEHFSVENTLQTILINDGNGILINDGNGRVKTALDYLYETLEKSPSKDNRFLADEFVDQMLSRITLASEKNIPKTLSLINRDISTLEQRMSEPLQESIKSLIQNLRDIQKLGSNIPFNQLQTYIHQAATLYNENRAGQVVLQSMIGVYKAQQSIEHKRGRAELFKNLQKEYDNYIKECNEAGLPTKSFSEFLNEHNIDINDFY